MSRTCRGGLRAAPFLAAAAALLAAGCASDPALVQRIHDLDQSLAESRKANDELRGRVTAAEQQLKANQAEMDRLRGRDEAYRKAQEALDEWVKKLQATFPEGAGEGDVTVERIQGGYKFVAQGDVLYRTGEADLTDEGKSALRRIAEQLKGRSERVRVEGHTDNVPIVKDETKRKFPYGNLDLSLQRALVAADLLIKDGIEPKRVSCAGFGEHQPRADNGSAEGKKKNRRVEILVQTE